MSRGKLWWSTTRGLAAFDFKTRKYRLYGVEQGITPAASDLAALPDGRIALSFADRIGLFDPTRLLADSTAPTPVITRLRLGSRDVSGSEEGPTFRIDGAPALANSMTVPHDHPPLTFEFSALHFASPGANRYAHRLEGLEPEWVETVASNRRATYTTLPPGRYEFRVKAANPDGLWSESTSSLMLTVLPPWWQTWWAYLTYAIAAVLLLVLTSRYRTRSLRARATELELQVQSRTRELVEQREYVESQARQLEELAGNEGPDDDPDLARVPDAADGHPRPDRPAAGRECQRALAHLSGDRQAKRQSPAAPRRPDAEPRAPQERPRRADGPGACRARRPTGHRLV